MYVISLECVIKKVSKFLLSRTFKPEISRWLPGLPVQMAGFTVLGV